MQIRELGHRRLVPKIIKWSTNPRALGVHISPIPFLQSALSLTPIKHLYTDFGSLTQESTDRIMKVSTLFLFIAVTSAAPASELHLQLDLSNDGQRGIEALNDATAHSEMGRDGSILGGPKSRESSWKVDVTVNDVPSLMGYGDGCGLHIITLNITVHHLTMF